ncbi:MAG: Holliday junction branch migration DNA helicase RuvB [Prochloraceae cyanobacterium]
MAIKRSNNGKSNKNNARKNKKSTTKKQNSPTTPSIVRAIATAEDNAEVQIRPNTLQSYIGQKELKETLKIAIAAAKGRNETMDHLLLYGPPGLGKTTMSLIIATEMGVDCKITAAPALERPRDVSGLLVNLKPGDVLFIDEIHRLNRIAEELLYPAMEDFRLDVTIGKGQASRIRSIPLKPFTLVGATTKVGLISSPLRDRFGLIQRLRFYELDELTQIVLRTAKLLSCEIDLDAAVEIARRGRGTPRIANRLIKRVRDYAQVTNQPQITQILAAEALDKYQVDRFGLDWTDRLILGTLIDNFHGGPVGIETIAAATGEDKKTIEEVIEPYLLQIGFLLRTSRGRAVTDKAREHLKSIDRK